MPRGMLLSTTPLRTISSTRRGRLDSVPSLEQFLHRSRALALYRTILRGTRRIADPATRAETRNFVRAEFEKHRAVTDLSHGHYLLSIGRTEWERLERFIGVL